MLTTIILTAHRQPNLVHEAIRSVLAQTCPLWELVIMDSGPLAAAGAYLRYGLQLRIKVHVTGERPEDSLLRCGQSFAINEAFRRGLVVGDLVQILSDDDLLSPHAVGLFQSHAAAHPSERAWYGTAHVQRITDAGHVEKLDPLQHRPGPGPHTNLRTHVDGLQACVRRGAWIDWPEAHELGGMADGYWLDALAEAVGVFPAPFLVGVHRRTPLSRWTQ